MMHNKASFILVVSLIMMHGCRAASANLAPAPSAPPTSLVAAAVAAAAVSPVRDNGQAALGKTMASVGADAKTYAQFVTMEPDALFSETLSSQGLQNLFQTLRHRAKLEAAKIRIPKLVLVHGAPFVGKTDLMDSFLDRLVAAYDCVCTRIDTQRNLCTTMPASLDSVAKKLGEWGDHICAKSVEYVEEQKKNAVGILYINGFQDLCTALPGDLRNIFHIISTLPKCKAVRLSRPSGRFDSEYYNCYAETIIIADSSQEPPLMWRRYFDRTIALAPLTERARAAKLCYTLRSIDGEAGIKAVSALDVTSIAQASAGLTTRELDTVAHMAAAAALCASTRLTESHLAQALASVRTPEHDKLAAAAAVQQ